ncbi:MAG: hypothetical protein RQ745_08480 [Longimicrobiales bacterium]|nr:hypothetical protein [Longimicrobiales bacterium]
MMTTDLVRFILFETRRRVLAWTSILAIGATLVLLTVAAVYTAGPRELLAHAFLMGVIFGMHTAYASDAARGFERFAVRNLISARAFVIGKLVSLLLWLTLFVLFVFVVALAFDGGEPQIVSDIVRLHLVGLILLPPSFALEVIFRTRLPVALTACGVLLAFLVLSAVGADAGAVFAAIGMGGEYGMRERGVRSLAVAALGFALFTPLTIAIVRRRAAITVPPPGTGGSSSGAPKEGAS